MNQRTSPLISIFSALLIFLWASALWAQTFDENVLIRTPITHDLYTASRHIEIQAEIAGDLIAAGQMISVNKTVHGDIIAAGELINLQGKVLDDVRAAGRQVIINGEITDHIVAAGETVTLESNSQIGSWAWLAGDTVRISGFIEQELRVAARKVIISGEIKGDVELYAEQVEILDGAHIHSDLIWHSNHQPQVKNDGQIDGQIINKPKEYTEIEHSSPAAGLAFMTVSLTFTGIVIYLLLPAIPLQASASLLHRPWLSLTIGLSVLLLTPLIIIILFVTAIGSLLAFALLAIYLVMILLGVICTLFALGLFGLHLAGKGDVAGKGLRIIAFIIAVAMIGLLQLIPLIGSLVYLAVVLFGLGGLSLAMYHSKLVSALKH